MTEKLSEITKDTEKVKEIREMVEEIKKLDVEELLRKRLNRLTDMLMLEMMSRKSLTIIEERRKDILEQLKEMWKDAPKEDLIDRLTSIDQRHRKFHFQAMVVLEKCQRMQKERTLENADNATNAANKLEEMMMPPEEEKIDG